MAKQSKFKVGMEVTIVMNKHDTYEVIEVLRNELKVKTLSGDFKDLVFSCKKSLFEVM